MGNEDGIRCMYLSAIDQGLSYPFVQFPGLLYAISLVTNNNIWGSGKMGNLPSHVSKGRKVKKYRQILSY